MPQRTPDLRRVAAWLFASRGSSPGSGKATPQRGVGRGERRRPHAPGIALIGSASSVSGSVSPAASRTPPRPAIIAALSVQYRGAGANAGNPTAGSASRSPRLALTPPPTTTDRAPTRRGPAAELLDQHGHACGLERRRHVGRALPGQGPGPAVGRGQVVADGGLEAAEAEVERVLAEQRAREPHGRRVAPRRELVERRPARVSPGPAGWRPYRRPRRPRRRGCGRCGRCRSRTRPGRAPCARRWRPGRRPAGGRGRRGGVSRVTLWRWGRDVVDADQRLARGPGQGLGGRDADEQRPDQPRPVRDRDGVDLLEFDPSRPQRLGDDRGDRFEAGPAGDLRHDPAVGDVQLRAAGQRVPEHPAARPPRPPRPSRRRCSRSPGPACRDGTPVRRGPTPRRGVAFPESRVGARARKATPRRGVGRQSRTRQHPDRPADRGVPVVGGTGRRGIDLDVRLDAPNLAVGGPLDRAAGREVVAGDGQFQGSI